MLNNKQKLMQVREENKAIKCYCKHIGVVRWATVHCYCNGKVKTRWSQVIFSLELSVWVSPCLASVTALPPCQTRRAVWSVQPPAWAVDHKPRHADLLRLPQPPGPLIITGNNRIQAERVHSHLQFPENPAVILITQQITNIASLFLVFVLETLCSVAFHNCYLARTNIQWEQ